MPSGTGKAGLGMATDATWSKQEWRAGHALQTHPGTTVRELLLGQLRLSAQPCFSLTPFLSCRDPQGMQICSIFQMERPTAHLRLPSEAREGLWSSEIPHKEPSGRAPHRPPFNAFISLAQSFSHLSNTLGG